MANMGIKHNNNLAQHPSSGRMRGVESILRGRGYDDISGLQIVEPTPINESDSGMSVARIGWRRRRKVRPKNKGQGHVAGWVVTLSETAHGYTNVLFGLRTKEGRTVPVAVDAEPSERAALAHKIRAGFMGQWVSVIGTVYYNEYGLPMLVDYGDMDFALTDRLRNRLNKMKQTLH